MTKRILGDTEYTFDASAQTITFTDGILLKHILLITNIIDNVIIYNFACEGRGGIMSSNTLTLEYDTTSMSDTDELSIIIHEENKGVETNRLLEILRKQTQVQDEMLGELKINNKYLRKIYNPE